MVGNHKLASINILSFIRFTHFNILLPVLKVGGSSPFGRASKKSLKFLVLQGVWGFSIVYFIFSSLLIFLCWIDCVISKIVKCYSLVDIEMEAQKYYTHFDSVVVIAGTIYV